MSDEPQPPVSDETVRAICEFAEVIGQAITDWFERMQPVWEQLAEIARHRPEILEAIEREQSRHVASQPCNCFCSRLHPDDMGICDFESVTTRKFASDVFGPVHVPMCAPCMVAQAVTEGMP